MERLRVVVSAAALASGITLIAAGIWNALLIANFGTTPAIPWSVPVMAVVLYVLWRYLSGAWPPRTNAAERRALLRARRVSRDAFLWSLVGGVSGLIALVGLWIVLVELAGTGGNPTLPDLRAYPPLTIALGIAMGSLVAPLSEEAAFRGYAQSLLERAFPPVAAIAISALFFAFWHGPTQGFLWNKLLFYFVVGALFGTIALRTGSILPAIPVHILGDVTFFTLVWPNDAARPLVARVGAGIDFWIALAEAIVFGILAVLALRRVRRPSASPAVVHLAQS